MLNNVLLKGLRERRVSLTLVGGGADLLHRPEDRLLPVHEEQLRAPGVRGVVFRHDDRHRRGTDFISPVGYLNSQLFFLMLPIVLCIFAISIGSDALAGEEGRGTLDLLLSTPLSRRRAVLEKFATMVLAVTLEAVVLYAAMALWALAVNMDINYLHMAGATFSLALLALVFGTLALPPGRGQRQQGDFHRYRRGVRVGHPGSQFHGADC